MISRLPLAYFFGKNMKETHKINRIINCLCQVVISNISLVLYILISGLCFHNKSNFLLLTVPTIFALVFQPILLAKVLSLYDNTKNVKYFLCGIIFLLLIFIIAMCPLSDRVILIIHFMIIAYSEEILYRVILLEELDASFNPLASIVISSLFFAFLGHLSEPILSNLIIRFPLGIILAFVKMKTHTVVFPTFVHALYNIMLVL